jgi:uncharacterized protein YbbC (DUF1343 family)
MPSAIPAVAIRTTGAEKPEASDFTRSNLLAMKVENRTVTPINWRSQIRKLCCLIMVFSTGIFQSCGNPQNVSPRLEKNDAFNTIRPGAEQTAEYFPLLRGKKIAVVANHTSLVGGKHLVDTLLKSGFAIQKVFAPEHGFRGSADAGERIASGKDPQTQLPVVSLYGENKKPTSEHLKGIDVVIFDIQDVGARFYTYISTMSYVMEACAENNIPVIILDRPNPNGHFVDGPILEPKYSTFVGLHSVPIAHGMTIGEYAQMVNGEGWLKNKAKCALTIIKVKNWTHRDFYQIDVPPSPNLKTMNAIYLYPSLCLFEGTIVSVGRGTAAPFEMIGYPNCPNGNFAFKPVSTAGSKNPPYENQSCNGLNLAGIGTTSIRDGGKLNISWLITLYNGAKEKNTFFTSFFDKLAGTEQLRKQIMEGKTEDEIRKSWEPGLNRFSEIRKKYLLYAE